MDAPKSENPFAEIANCSGLSGGYLFLRDYDSKPGRVICHFVRLESMEFEDTVALPPLMNASDPKSDPRLKHLARCFQEPANKIVQGLLAVCSDLMTSIGEVLRLRIAVGTQAQRIKWARSLALASYFIQHGEMPKAPPPAPTPAAPPPVAKEKLLRCSNDLFAAGLKTPLICERCGKGPCPNK